MRENMNTTVRANHCILLQFVLMSKAGLFLRSPFHRAFIVSLQTRLTSLIHTYIVRGQRTGA